MSTCCSILALAQGAILVPECCMAVPLCCCCANQLVPTNTDMQAADLPKRLSDVVIHTAHGMAPTHNSEAAAVVAHASVCCLAVHASKQLHIANYFIHGTVIHVFGGGVLHKTLAAGLRADGRRSCCTHAVCASVWYVCAVIHQHALHNSYL